MKRKLSFGLFIVLGIVFMFAACAKPPTTEVEAAQSALSRAQADADAREYAPDSITRAENLVKRMQSALDAKEYDSAKSLALEAKDAAEKAIADGTAAKEKARVDASTAISNAKNLLTEVRKALNGAKSVRGIRLDIPVTESDTNAAAQTVTAADADFTNAAYTAAYTKAQDARSALAGIQRRIADAVQVATRRK